MIPSYYEKSEEQQEQNIQDPISQLIGEFGLWQRKITILVALCTFPYTFHIFLPTFTAAQQRYWCARPPHLKRVHVFPWIYYSQPANGCVILDTDWNSMIESDLRRSPPLVNFIPCSDWEYATETFASTIVSEWSLVCDYQYLQTICNFCFLFGIAVGGPISGIISDRIGRKKVLIVSICTQTVSGIIMAVSPWFGLYLVCKVFLGLACISIVTSGLILAVETVSGKWCMIVAVCTFTPMPFAYIIVSLASMVVPNWRHLQLIFSLPSAIFISYWWILPESPRWLLSMGRIDDVISLIEEAAAYNALELPDSIGTFLYPFQSVNRENTHVPGFKDLFRAKYKKITICVAIITATTHLLYYGLVLNIASFQGNLHTFTIIFAVIEIPARLLCLYVLMKLGRRLPICIAIIVSGVGCFAAVIVHETNDLEWLTPDFHWMTILFVAISRFSICATNNAMLYYTAELYPTHLRDIGVETSQMYAGISLVCLPFLWTLLYPLPLFIMGLVGVIGGLSVLLLPETMAIK